MRTAQASCGLSVSQLVKHMQCCCLQSSNYHVGRCCPRCPEGQGLVKGPVALGCLPEALLASLPGLSLRVHRPGSQGREARGRKRGKDLTTWNAGDMTEVPLAESIGAASRGESDRMSTNVLDIMVIFSIFLVIHCNLQNYQSIMVWKLKTENWFERHLENVIHVLKI